MANFGQNPYGTGGDSAGSAVWWALRRVLLWGGLCLVVSLVLGNRFGGLWQGAGAPAEPSAMAQQHAPPNTLVYRADRSGHVFLQAEVNGAPIRFLVDTGATFVSLSRDDAAAAGIGAAELVFNAPMNTANGRAYAARVMLRELRLGQLTLYDVPAIVNQYLKGVALLGMSFLNRLQSYEMRDGVLTINYQ
jgi:aspartyl protease family protein